MALEFEWQPEKAAKNRRKHKVLFEEAATVFADEMSATLYDPDHSDDEERFLTIGYSNRGRLLVVSHTGRGTRLRIINARPLTPKERRQYEEAE